MKLLLKISLVILLQIWGCSSTIRINVRESYDSNDQLKTYKITAPGVYEMVAAGAAGGGDKGVSGGKGGISAGYIDLIQDQVINVYIGSQGDNIDEQKCGGAGGGGATTVYLSPAKNAVTGTILLVGPGGGGAGYNQIPSAPDYNDELIDPVIGNCPKCDHTNKTCIYSAAKGKDIKDYMNVNPVDLTYNPSKLDNFTRGCYGGYGGGGQGGAWKDVGNRTTHGGGGGGGGHIGGLVGVAENAVSCSAGGPGKAFCGMTKCNVTRVNDDIEGYFIIRIHQRYKELALRDRTNNESPSKGQGVGGTGRRIEFSHLNGIMMIFISYLLLMKTI